MKISISDLTIEPKQISYKKSVIPALIKFKAYYILEKEESDPKNKEYEIEFSLNIRGHNVYLENKLKQLVKNITFEKIKITSEDLEYEEPIKLRTKDKDKKDTLIYFTLSTFNNNEENKIKGHIIYLKK